MFVRILMQLLKIVFVSLVNGIIYYVTLYFKNKIKTMATNEIKKGWLKFKINNVSLKEGVLKFDVEICVFLVGFKFRITIDTKSHPINAEIDSL